MINKKSHQNSSSTLITDFKSLASEAVQKLETNITFAAVDKPIKVIAITSALQSEGKSSLTCNMANIYAERGAKVCVINLDLRRPSIHHYYHIPNKIGVEEYVSKEASLEQILIHLPNGVDIINAGTLTPFPNKILSSPNLDVLVAQLRENYDYILVDTAPVLLVTDALLCTRFIDGYLLVVAQHSTTKKDAVAAASLLKDSHVNVLGTVMTQVTDFKEVGEGGDSHYYYYEKEKKSEQ